MKKVIIGFAVLIAAVSAQAQDAQKAEERVGDGRKAMQEFFQSLDLSDEQRTSLEDVMKKYADEVRQLDRSPENRAENFQRVRELNDERDAELKDILSKEQYAQYEKKQKELRANARKSLRKAGRPN